jgi:hypothetical protein
MNALTDPFNAIEELEIVLSEHQETEARLLRAVRKARDVGVSWTDIGHSLGITKQGAHKRFGKAIYSGQVS